MLEQQMEHNQSNYLRSFNAIKQPFLDVPSNPVSDLSNERELVIKATLRAEDLEAYCDVLTRVESHPLIGEEDPWTEIAEVVQQLRDHHITGKAILHIS